MKATTSSNNVKTLALLLDNLVLDFVGIRLAPGGAAFGQTTNEEYAEPPATGRLLPGEGSKSVCSVYDCNDICEAREEKLLQIIDANDFNDEACVTIPQAQQEKDDLVGFVMGAGGGINIITPNAVAANFAVDVALEFKYVAAVARVGYELDSSFEVKGRPMSTKAGTLNLGSRFFLHKKRLLMGIDVVAVFRYYHISRADMPNANVYEFLDMGIGIHPVLAVDFTSVLGMFFSAGVEIYPRARQIVIEGGPSERIGFAVFSINSGFFMRF